MLKVMIVEDEMLVRLGLKNSVDWAKHGMAVYADVPNGKAALEIYHREKPDIILTDIKMPVMDGIELIARIRETDGDTVIAVLTCLEEFGLVKKAMTLGVSDYVLKLTATGEEIDELLERLRRQAERSTRPRGPERLVIQTGAPEDLVKNFLFYGMYGPEEFAAGMSEAGIRLDPDGLTLVLAELDRYQSLKKLFEDEKGFLTNFAFMNVLNEILDKNGVAVHERDGRYIILLNRENAGRTSALRRIAETAGAYFNISLTFALSSVRNGYENLPEMYREAEISLRWKFIYGSGIYGPESGGDAPPALREKLERLYAMRDLSAVSDEILWAGYGAKVGAMIESLSPEPSAVKDALCVLLHWLSRQLYLTSDEDGALLVSHERELLRAETLDDALLEVSRYITVLNNALRAKKHLRPEISGALQYIGENFKNNISLPEVAKHVGLSPSYFSTLFRKEMDETMTDYLNALRVEEAKRLLRETDMKTYEVSEAAGFWESTYFNALFKRTTGVTPHKYRQQWQSGEEKKS